MYVKLKSNRSVFILKSFAIFPSKAFMCINGKYGKAFSNITGKPNRVHLNASSMTNLFSLALTEEEEKHYSLLSSLIPSHEILSNKLEK